MRAPRFLLAALTPVLTLALLVSYSSTALAQTYGPPSFQTLGNELGNDFKYTIDNVQMDAVDIGTSPLHIASKNSPFRSPKFYLAAAGVGAVWGGAFALDQTMRVRFRGMSSSDANLLQNVSYASVGGASALLYGYGLYTGNVRARHYALTAGEAAGVATLFDDFVIKYAFGRLRPRQDGHSHTQFFDGGRSFVSGDVTPVFALATGISEYYHNKWYIALPIYSAALADGFGRMGHDAHWFSDVVGAAMLGWGTTELMLYLHKQHAEQPHRWRIFPVSAPSPAGTASVGAPMGIGFQYSW